MTGGLGRARSATALLLLAAPLAFAACAGTGYHYVKSSENKTYFKVPDSWKLYDQDSVLDALKGALSKDEIDQRRDTMWTTVFDANPDPSLNHLAGNRPNYPLGQAVVRPLSPDASDAASLQSLRNIFFDVDDALEAGNAHVSAYDLVELGGGFHGSHLVARVEGKTSSITFNQIALFDQSTSKVYAISIYCTTECYDKYESKIDSVINSWTVKDK
ncbi:MAG: hypothetical protein WD271_14885 [Acidimicrobiia bacterium]